MYKIWILLIIEQLQKTKNLVDVQKFNNLRKVFNDKELFELVDTKKIFYEKLSLFDLKLNETLKAVLFDNKYFELIKYYNEYFIKNNIKITKLYNTNEYILCSGNIELLENKLRKIYFLDINGISNRNKKIKNYFLEDIEDKYIVNVEILKNKKFNNILNKKSKYIFLCDFDIFYLEQINCLPDSLYIFSNIEVNSQLSQKLVYILSSICDEIFLLEASYEQNNVLFLDYAIEQGKNIYVTPGNIYQKNTYFSNYLISQGAEIILGKKDFINIVEKR